jgi:hypothetical protein
MLVWNERLSLPPSSGTDVMDVVPRQEDWASQATCMCVNTCVHVHACMHIINRSHPSHKSLMMEAEMVSKTLEIHSILACLTAWEDAVSLRLPQKFQMLHEEMVECKWASFYKRAALALCCGQEAGLCDILQRKWTELRKKGYCVHRLRIRYFHVCSNINLMHTIMELHLHHTSSL